MLTRLVMAWLLVACSSDRASPPAEPPRAPAPRPRPALDASLPCVVDGIVALVNSSNEPFDTLQMAVDFEAMPIDRGPPVRFVDALVTRLAATPDLRVPRAVILGRAAMGLARIGETVSSVVLAEQVLGGIEGLSTDDRWEAITAATFALTAAGKDPPAVVVEEKHSIATLYAAQGLARAGKQDRAKALLATLPPPTDDPTRGALAMVMGWLGDVEAGRALVASASEMKPSVMAWFAHALVRAKHPQALAVVDTYLAELRTLAEQAPDPEQMVYAGAVWTELVRYRESLDRAGSAAARGKLHDWLLAKPDARRDLRGINLVRATLAGNTAEAARLGAPPTALIEMEVAFAKDELAAGLDALEKHRQERARLLATVGNAPAGLLDGASSAELTAWLILASKSRVPDAIAQRFKTLACAPSK